jgi:dolichyl-phosphate-mannose-protein mannosyltransferase
MRVCCTHTAFAQLLTAAQQKSGFISILDEWEFLIAPIIFTALAFFTRMWRIGLSPIVTWDEAQ